LDDNRLDWGPKIGQGSGFPNSGSVRDCGFVVVFRIRDDNNPDQSSRLTKWGHFNSEEGSLRGKPSHASCHAVSFGEKVASKYVMVCAHQLEHT
jgi:hypothetical protein